MIVRNGDLTLESTDHERTMQSITNLVTANGGYVSNQSTRHTDDAKIFSELTVRIPVEHFDSVLSAIKKTGSEVVSENISAEDQTKRYYDLEGHFAAKRLEMTQMQDLMKSAKSMTDIITIKKEILDLQADIDDIEGMTKQIANEVSYSTLRIEIMSRANNAFFPKIGSAIGKGFSSFSDVLGDTISFVISKSPVFAALLGFIYLIMWMSRRGRRKEKEREKPTTPTAP
jgi:predicted component of type VI protein secretion system